MQPLAENLLVELAAVLRDPVTTTDELIPSGETSSYRSNPLRLAEFTLSRREPAYVGRAKAAAEAEAARLAGSAPAKLTAILDKVGDGAALAKDHPVRLLRVRPQARRRLRPGAGRLLPEGAGGLRQHLL